MEEKIITESKIEGDLEFQGILIFKNNVEITGNVRAVGIRTYLNLTVGGYLNVDGNLTVGGYLNVGGYLTVDGNLTVGGYLNVDGNLTVGGYLNVGCYINQSFLVLDFNKIKTNRIMFTSSIYHERNFWLEILKPLEIDELNKAIEKDCWDECIKFARRHKKQIFSQRYLPAVEQALHLMLD